MLKENVDRLGDLLLTPLILDRKILLFKAALAELLEGLQKYLNYLDLASKKMSANHQQHEPVRLARQTSVVEGNNHADKEYEKLKQEMEKVDYYEPVELC
ncbi:hypothetical protein DPMN_159951 [Dreissena polymorpha]|uniref:Uncharacterized protein n=1 Tax=Dreissena polymorpha TaxID=45954 RepID=A0A9D4EQ62_DREPO|nr:hypothetical protein DPMN_159951 [Dreissena polymorpha]